MKPVLYLDTCAILDILRDPRRSDTRPRDQRASIQLLEAAETERLDVFLTALVRREFADNVDAVERDAERGLSSIIADVAKIDALASLHGSPGNAQTRHWHGHIVRCRQVADRWLNVGQDAEESDAVSRRAMTRVLERRPPSRRGQDSTKDCLILETYLEHARSAAQTGLRRTVFVSSNTRDYAASATRLPNELASDFANVLMDFAPNMAAAESLIWA